MDTNAGKNMKCNRYTLERMSEWICLGLEVHQAWDPKGHDKRGCTIGRFLARGISTEHFH